MPAAMPVTLKPRTAGRRARDALSSPGVRGRAREATGSFDLLAFARDGLSSIGVSARAREALAAVSSDLGRRYRLALEAQRLRDQRLHPHDLSLFSSNQHHPYRLDGRGADTWPTPRWERARAGGGRPERLGAAAAAAADAAPRLDPLQLPAFELPPRSHNVPTPPNLHFTYMINPAYANAKRPASGGYGGGSDGSGYALLALVSLIVLASVVARCLDLKFFKQFRKRSDKWFKQKLLATSHDVREEGAEVDMECPDVSLLAGDSPPPYSTCQPKSPQAGTAEPPPPYSACYVAFPHDLPGVHPDVPLSFQDTGQSGVAPHSEVLVATEVPRGSTDGIDTDLAESRPAGDVASQGASAFPNSLVA